MLKSGWVLRARALPWPDIGVAAAVVIVGFSQPFFALILENRDYFPREAWFHLGVLAWVGLLPLAGLLAADLGIRRLAGRERCFAVWRASLYTILFASFLRQAQVYYPSPFQWILERIPPLPLVLSLLALVFLLCLRSRVGVHRFVASLGMLGVLLTFSYAAKAGLLGSAWRGVAVAPKAAATPSQLDPVVIVVFDELSNDILLKGGRIDPELFPNFAALAEDSAWFPTAATNHLHTLEALPCLLTGRLRPPEGTPLLFDYLPEAYGVVARDYFFPIYGWMRRNVRRPQSYISLGSREDPLRGFLEVPGELAWLFRQTPFSRSPFSATPSRRLLPRLFPTDSKTNHAWQDEIQGFLSGVNARDLAGSVLYWHSPIPHFPFNFNPDGSLHDSVSNEFLVKAADGAEPRPGYDLAATLENYRKQVRYADHVLGRLVDSLKREGLYERTTLIVTSDHGLRTWGAIGPANWPEEIAGDVARVPLMLRGPLVKRGVYAVDYQHMDFTPTLLEALGIPYDAAAFEGVSGFAPSRPARPKLLMDSQYRRYRYDAARDLWLAPPPK